MRREERKAQERHKEKKKALLVLLHSNFQLYTDRDRSPRLAKATSLIRLKAHLKRRRIEMAFPPFKNPLFPL